MLALYLLTFVVLYYGYKIWKAARLPPELAELPVVPTSEITKGYFAGRPVADTQRQLFLPRLEKKGIVRHFDPIFRLWIVTIARPDLFKEVLLRSDVFPKYDQSGRHIPIYEVNFLGRSNILFDTKEQHRRHRRIANPTFHHKWPTTLFGNLMKDLFVVLDKDCVGDAKVNVLGFIQSFTLDVLGRAAFDYEFRGLKGQNDAVINAYNSAMVALGDLRYVFLPFLEKIPGYERNDVNERVNFLNDLIREIVAKKRVELQNLKATGQKSSKEKDLLTLMLEAEQAESDPDRRLTTEELMNDLKVFFVAGHDTTATALAAAIFYLGMYPEIQQKAREEVISILGDPKEDVIPTSEQIREMKYINMIIQEVLRIHPPASSTSIRLAEKDAKLGEFFIPKGTVIMASIFSLHHNKNVWPDPFRFDPERFRDEKEIQGTYKWLPFGSGSRICIGMNFSLTEQRVALSMMLRKYTWTIPKDTIHQEDGMKIVRAYLALSVPKDLRAQFRPRY